MATDVAPVPLAAAQVGEASEMLARAFHDDPPNVWLFPDEEKRRRALLGNFVSGPIRPAVRRGVHDAKYR